MKSLSVRRLWIMYRKVLAGEPLRKRDLILARLSFYAGAHSVLKVLDKMRDEGDIDELQRTIQRHGRTTRALHGRKRDRTN